MRYASLFVIALMVLTPGFSRPAAAAGMHGQEHIDTMRQAADELEATNPDLAEKLNKFADKKEEWKEEMGADKWAQKQQDLETTRRAAEHLKNDTDAEGKELGGQLEDVVNRWEEKMNKMKEKMKDTTE